MKSKRGRTNITPAKTRPTAPHVEVTRRVEADRPISAGTGKHRGDRRDMSPTYTGNERHASRGNAVRKDVSTRKR